MVYVGIDVAKDFHECAILSQDKEVLLAPFSFSNTKEGFVYLKEMINLAGNADPLNVKIGLEATGHYSVALLSFLEHNGWRIIYLNPLYQDKHTPNLKIPTFQRFLYALTGEFKL